MGSGRARPTGGRAEPERLSAGLARGRAWRKPDQRSVVRHRFLGSASARWSGYSLRAAGLVVRRTHRVVPRRPPPAPARSVRTANHGRGMSGTGITPHGGRRSAMTAADTAPAGMPIASAAAVSVAACHAAVRQTWPRVNPRARRMAKSRRRRRKSQRRRAGARRRQREAAERNAQQHRQVPHSAEVDQVRRRRWFLGMAYGPARSPARPASVPISGGSRVGTGRSQKAACIAVRRAPGSRHAVEGEPTSCSAQAHR